MQRRLLRNIDPRRPLSGNDKSIDRDRSHGAGIEIVADDDRCARNAVRALRASPSPCPVATTKTMLSELTPAAATEATSAFKSVIIAAVVPPAVGVNGVVPLQRPAGVAVARGARRKQHAVEPFADRVFERKRDRHLGITRRWQIPTRRTTRRSTQFS